MNVQRKLDVKKLRAKYGLTQFKLAQKVGVSVNAVTRWENFVAVPSESNYLKLVKIFEALRITKED